MSSTDLSDEANFPGNSAILTKISAACERGGLIVVSGAGISAPALPLWSQLIDKLAKDAVTEGILGLNDSQYINDLCRTDPLSAATHLQETMGHEILKAKVAQTFRSPHHVTPAHKALMALPASLHLTLNYDVGLENAYTEIIGGAPEVFNSSDP